MGGSVILVVGGTGALGGPVVRRLVEDGWRVRLLVRGEAPPSCSAAHAPAERAKWRAEEAIRASGVGYTIFKPTYFMDTLPRHVQGRRAVAIGRRLPAVHMVAAADFAGMVSRAFRTPEAAGRELFVHGPQAFTIADALRAYCQVVEPDKRVAVVPLPVMALANRFFLGGKLTREITLMRLMQRVGERGDPAEANRLLGTPTTTLLDWCQRQAREQRRPTAA